MNNKIRITRTGKSIPRVKIADYRESSRNEHSQPYIHFLDKVGAQPSIVTDEKKQSQLLGESRKKYPLNANRSFATNLSEINLHDATYFQTTFQHPSDQKISTSFMANSKACQARISSLPGDYADPKALPKESSEGSKQTSYMSYAEYQSLLSEGLVKPGHFEVLARRNDQQKLSRTGYKTQFADHFGQKRTQKSESGKKIAEGALRAIKRKNYTQLSTTYNQPSTIINSKVGALSNMAIRQRLENQQIDLFHRKVKPTRFTEESEGDSDKDVKQSTIREEITSGKKLQHKPHGRAPLREEARRLPSNKYQQLFEKIYSTGGLGSQESTGRGYSYGDEYCLQEEKMMHFNEIYQVKKTVLKHKLDWRV